MFSYDYKPTFNSHIIYEKISRYELLKITTEDTLNQGKITLFRLYSFKN